MRWINDVYFKFATTDRGVSVRCGYSNNNLIGNTDNKEITTAYQRAGIGYHSTTQRLYFMLIVLRRTRPLSDCIGKEQTMKETVEILACLFLIALVRWYFDI